MRIGKRAKENSANRITRNRIRAKSVVISSLVFEDASGTILKRMKNKVCRWEQYCELLIDVENKRKEGIIDEISADEVPIKLVDLLKK